MPRDEIPWYSVVDARTREKAFEAKFFDDAFDPGSLGFTFDAPNGETWLCHGVDEGTLTIFGESLDEYMTRAIGGCLAAMGDSNVEGEISYHVVDGGRHES